MNNVGAFIFHLVLVIVCLSTVGYIVGGEFGFKWGLAAVAALWVLMPGPTA